MRRYCISESCQSTHICKNSQEFNGTDEKKKKHCHRVKLLVRTVIKNVFYACLLTDINLKCAAFCKGNSNFLYLSHLMRMQIFQIFSFAQTTKKKGTEPKYIKKKTIAILIHPIFI